MSASASAVALCFLSVAATSAWQHGTSTMAFAFFASAKRIASSVAVGLLWHFALVFGRYLRRKPEQKQEKEPVPEQSRGNRPGSLSL